MSRWVSLTLFLLLVALTAAFSSSFTAGEWYQLMHQPGWNPPAVAMALAWPVYYMLLALVAWLVWDRERAAALKALTCWSTLLVLNVLWSWLFFERHRVGWALAVMGLWIVLVVVSFRKFRPLHRQASAWLLLAGGWLLFVCSLNAMQWYLNGGGLTSIFN